MRFCLFALVVMVLSGRATATTPQQFVNQTELALDVLCQWATFVYTRSGYSCDDSQEPASVCSEPTYGDCDPRYGSDCSACVGANSTLVAFNESAMACSSTARASSRFHEAWCRALDIDRQFATAASMFTNSGLSPMTLNIGLPSGVMRTWPHFNWGRWSSSGGCLQSNSSTCNTEYDPRGTSWFNMAAHGAVDVAIVVDLSAVMREQDRLSKALHVVTSVLTSLEGQSNYFALVAFGITSTPSVLSFSSSSDSNTVQSAITWLTSLAQQPAASSYDGTELDVAINTALAMMQTRGSSNSSNCRSALLAFTGSQCSTSVYNPSGTRLFMYSYGTSDDVFEQHKDLSCNTGGYWDKMADDMDSAAQATTAFSWTKFLANGLTETPLMWLDPQSDSNGAGLGQVLYVARSCQWFRTVPPTFLGVAMAQFSVDNSEQVRSFLSSGYLDNITSRPCPSIQLTEYHMNEMRLKRCKNLIDFAYLWTSVALAAVIVVITATSIAFSVFLKGKLSDIWKSHTSAPMDPTNEHAKR